MVLPGLLGGRVGRCQIQELDGEYNLQIIQARSSVGEHYLDTVGVVGSIPTVPTNPPKDTGGDHRHSQIESSEQAR